MCECANDERCWPCQKEAINKSFTETINALRAANDALDMAVNRYVMPK